MNFEPISEILGIYRAVTNHSMYVLVQKRPRYTVTIRVREDSIEIESELNENGYKESMNALKTLASGFDTEESLSGLLNQKKTKLFVPGTNSKSLGKGSSNITRSPSSDSESDYVCYRFNFVAKEEFSDIV